MSWGKERFQWLAEKAENLTSQWGENGLISAIFERIGTANKFCCEAGAGDGVFFSNTWPLLNNEGWSGLQIEANEGEYAKLATLYMNNPNVTCFNYKVHTSGAFSFDRLLEKAKAPKDFDLLVIDVDLNDYHLWNSLYRHRPRVVICEFDPNAEGGFIPPIGGDGQAGLDAIIRLGIGKLYWPIIVTRNNVIFVQQELCDKLVESESVKCQSWDYGGTAFSSRAKAVQCSEPVVGKSKSGDSYCAKHLAKTDHVNVQSVADQKPLKIVAIASTPRLGFMSTMDCVIGALSPLNIPLLRGEGCWWHHSLTRGMEKALESGAEFILTIDYDSVFDYGATSSDIARLVCLLIDNPDVDVIVPFQMKREGGELLASTGKEVSLAEPLIPINTGHFGLTLFRRSVFERLPKPWFNDFPNEKGEWNEDRIDADIHFWRQCSEIGIQVRLATDVVIGHLELLATYPNSELKPLYIPLNDLRQRNMKPPDEAFNRQRVVQHLATLEMN
jgi:hypothetical protein